jgi:hypothetical protein
MSAAHLLARRARALEQLALQFRLAARNAHGPRAAALRETSRELEAEALRFTMAAAGASDERPAHLGPVPSLAEHGTITHS